jgi:hypothetical protein
MIVLRILNHIKHNRVSHKRAAEFNFLNYHVILFCYVYKFFCGFKIGLFKSLPVDSRHEKPNAQGT